MTRTVPMPEKALNRLLADFTVIEERHQDILACGLTLSSAEVEPGYVFFACQGANRHGIDYAKQAVERGAVAIVVEHVRGIEAKLAQIHIPTILVEDLTRHLSEIAARFFDHPSKKLEVIGVTGTNGKTSVAQFIAHTLTGWGGRCAVLGTLGNGLWGQLSPATHTTSDAITTQRHIYEALFNGAQYVVMEVSSHALDQHRVAAVDFDIAVFTNLTRDHLDYHGTMESYSEAKKKLFLMESVKCAIINGDDAFGVQLAQSLVNTKQILNYTVAGASEKIESNVIMLLLERLHVNGMSVRVTFNGKSVTFDCELLGRFNVSNLAAVIGVLLAKDIALSDLPALFSGIKAPKGRMEKFGGVNQKPLVVVDYAHTPDAIRQALISLREHTKGSLWIVFGCGGDRDKGKRPLMAQAAIELADHIVVTDDNPRSENPERIVADILCNLKRDDKVEIIHDRQAAIFSAVNRAVAEDAVLVAGKGHEDYQIVGNERLRFVDQEVVESALEAA